MNSLTSLPQQDRSEEIAFFNRFTQNGDYDSLTDHGYQALMRGLDHYLRPHWPHIHSAVDLGCGTGSFTRRFLTRNGVAAFGVDVALTAVQRAKEKNDAINYFVSDINALGIKDNSMDLVIFSGVLHHFPDVRPCLQEAHRILTDNGIVVCYEPHVKNPCMWLYRHPDSPLSSTQGRTRNERLLSASEMRQTFQEVAFTEIQTQAISGVGISYLESPTARMFLPFYNAAEFLFGLTPLAKTFGSFLLCCAQKQKRRD